MRKTDSIIDKKSATDFVRCTTLAFTLQVAVAMLVMFLTSSDVAAEQSRISSIYATPGYLSKETILQFLIVSLGTSVLRHIIISGKIIKIQSVSLRIGLMFFLETILVAIAVWQFKWFYATNVASWIGFVIGALPCLIAGILLAYKSERKENEEMNAALRKKQNEE